MRIESGSITLKVMGAKTPTPEQQVTFTAPFPQIPVVVCSLDDTGPFGPTAYLSCMAFAVSKTGFTAILKYIGQVPQNQYDVKFNWIAVLD